MYARFIHDGKTIDYTPSEPVKAGDIVPIGIVAGIAHLDMEAGRLGAIRMSGVYDVAKGDGEEITTGEFVYWDSQRKVASSSYGDCFLGMCIVPAAPQDQTVRVRLIFSL